MKLIQINGIYIEVIELNKGLLQELLIFGYHFHSFSRRTLTARQADQKLPKQENPARNY